MMNIQLLLHIILFISTVEIAAFFVFYLFTKKFNQRYKNFYSSFFNITIREILLKATTLLNFLLILYFVFDISSFSKFGWIILLVTNIYSCILSLNVSVIISNIIYTSISIILLWLLEIVHNYTYFILYDSYTVFLKILFMILIIVYAIFISIRREELLLKKYKFRRHILWTLKS